MRYFKSWKMMLWKCCIQYTSKFGKLSNGHKTGKVQFSFQSQRRAMPKNAQTTAQLHSSHMLAKQCSKLVTAWEMSSKTWRLINTGYPNWTIQIWSILKKEEEIKKIKERMKASVTCGIISRCLISSNLSSIRKGERKETDPEHKNKTERNNGPKI